jgi:UDP-glucose 4-epimerase
MELANVDVIFVTGSSGRLGSALCEDLCNGKTRIIGIDPKPGRHTSYHSDRVEDAFATLKRGEIFVVFHCGALHKPDITRNTREEFIQANVLFTARLIRLARENEGLVRFVFTSTTSVFGAVMSDRDSRSKCKVHGCAFLTNASEPCPKNIYGITKLSAESVIYDHLDGRFITLRACRFFPEEDDRETKHDDLSEDNLKFLHVLNGRRLLLSDVVAAHKAALLHKTGERSEVLNLGNVVSLTEEMTLDGNADKELLKAYPFLQQVLDKRPDWKIPKCIDRVYQFSSTFEKLNWRPVFTPEQVAKLIVKGKPVPW